MSEHQPVEPRQPGAWAAWREYNAGVYAAREAYAETMHVVDQRTRRNQHEKRQRQQRKRQNACAQHPIG